MVEKADISQRWLLDSNVFVHDTISHTRIRKRRHKNRNLTWKPAMMTSVGSIMRASFGEYRKQSEEIHSVSIFGAS